DGSGPGAHGPARTTALRGRIVDAVAAGLHGRNVSARIGPDRNGHAAPGVATRRSLAGKLDELALVVDAAKRRAIVGRQSRREPVLHFIGAREEPASFPREAAYDELLRRMKLQICRATDKEPIRGT